MRPSPDHALSIPLTHQCRFRDRGEQLFHLAAYLDRLAGFVHRHIRPAHGLAGGNGSEQFHVVRKPQRQGADFQRRVGRHEFADDGVAAFAVEDFAGFQVALRGGDSIGEGLHLATNIPSPANRFNVAIYTPFIFQQIKQMPRGATVFMSLGTNDAVGGALDVDKRVEAIVAAAEAQGIKLYWSDRLAF